MRQALAVAFMLTLALSLAACGVKLPPIAPEPRPAPATVPKLDCSAQDETCDKEDPHYRPRGP